MPARRPNATSSRLARSSREIGVMRIAVAAASSMNTSG